LIFVAEAKSALKVEDVGSIIGETYSKPGLNASNALTYGLARANVDATEPMGSYIHPELVSHLPDVINQPKKGPLEIVEEIPTVKNYYDGGEKLNLTRVNCKINANPTDCLHQSSCGWCGATSSCIMGNNLGPMQPCLKSTFIFSGNTMGWEQSTRHINENVGNISLTVATN